MSRNYVAEGWVATEGLHKVERLTPPSRSNSSVLFFTSHFHSPNYRKTDIHLFAEALTGQGYSVDIATVGQSRLKQWQKPDIRRLARSAMQSGADSTVGSHVVPEYYHPPSGGPIVNFVTSPLLWGYGTRLDQRAAELAKRASVIFLEAGYPLFYFEALKAAAPHARICGLMNDDLAMVGFRPEVVNKASQTLGLLDMVRVPAEGLLAKLPSGSVGRYIPHGVEKQRFDQCSISPYAQGTRNAVAVGNMLFDQPVIRALAESRPEISVHVIGADVPKPRHANIIVHGEMAFDATIPFIKFADVGVAPYNPRPGMEYLAQSSMKLLQYSYCGLPVLLPRQLGSRRINVVDYDPNDSGSIPRALDKALAMGRVNKAARDVIDWNEAAQQLLASVDEKGTARALTR